MHPADRDLVDQGHESVLFPAVYQQGLAGPSQGRREMPEQGGPGEPGAEDYHARTAPDAHATSRPRVLRSGTSLFPSLHSSSSGSISFGLSPLGETLYKTRGRT